MWQGSTFEGAVESVADEVGGEVRTLDVLVVKQNRTVCKEVWRNLEDLTRRKRPRITVVGTDLNMYGHGEKFL